MKIKQFIQDIPAMLLGTLIATVAVYFFLIPSGLAIGSVSGFAIVLNRFIPLSVSTITFIINVILLILGASASIKPLTMGGITQLDLGMVVGSAVMLMLSALMVGKRRITRLEGAIFFLVYVAYVIVLLT